MYNSCAFVRLHYSEPARVKAQVCEEVPVSSIYVLDENRSAKALLVTLRNRRQKPARTKPEGKPSQFGNVLVILTAFVRTELVLSKGADSGRVCA